ncbi:hypothetical protein OG612_42470 (plasmid) [Streptomyces sp. NBC_01527]|uniref:hypothetical protein n=1 Tax=unclassified Streptomyces TaxID=2593676 RepID=UPI002E109C64|nr:hypothetical protein OG763_45735 [Streptomyces sp. NBC_01230]
MAHDGVDGSEMRAAPPPPGGMPTGVITLFAVPLGLAGLGRVWVEARLLRAPRRGREIPRAQGQRSPG